MIENNNPPKPNVLLDTKDDLMQLEMMENLSVNPDKLYEQLVGSGVEEDDANRQVEEAIDSLAREVLLPEAKVGLLKEASEFVDSRAIEATYVARAEVNSLTDLIDDIKRQAQAGTMSTDDVRTAINLLFSVTSGEKPDHFALSRAKDSLYEFSRLYTGQADQLGELADRAIGATVRTSDAFESTASSVVRTIKSAEEDEAAIGAAPQALLHQGVLRLEVAERGRGTINEHGADCEEEINSEDNYMLGVRQRLMDGYNNAQDILGPLKIIQNDVYGRMPNAASMRHATEMVAGTVEKLLYSEGTDSAAPYMMEQLVTELASLVTQASDSFRAIDSDANVASSRVASVAAAVSELDHMIHAHRSH